MRQWVLVPETFHDDTDGLAPWVRKAHAAALDRAPSRHAEPAGGRGERRQDARPRAASAADRQSSSKV